MKFTTSVDSLRSTLALAAVITPSAHQLDAFTAVHLATTPGTLTVRGRNDDTTVTAKLSVVRPEVGQVLIKPGPLLKYLSTFAGDAQVAVSAETTTSMQVSVNGAVPYQFIAMTETFPATAVPRRDKVPVDLSGLTLAVDAAAVCAAPLPTGGGPDPVVQLVSSPAGVKVQATDRQRVGFATLPEGSSFGTFDGLLPVPVMKLIASINPTHVQLDPRGRTIVFHSDSATVDTRLAQAAYPPVSSILEMPRPNAVSFGKDVALSALKRLGAVAGVSGDLRLQVHQDELTLSISNDAAGTGQETVNLEEATPAELDMLINVAFFTQAVRAQASDVVTMRWDGPLSPLLVTADAAVVVAHAIAPKRAAA